MLLNIFTDLVALAAISTFVLHLHLDYLSFKALGPGGTPPTIPGFLRIKLLSLLAVRNPIVPRQIPSRDARIGYLNDLPKRESERPVTRGIAPHRQITQKATANMLDRLASGILAVSSETDNVVQGISCIEKHGLALFSMSMRRPNEVCHLHSSDGSMHAVLAPADSMLILEAGWGERHPLSHGGWFERFVPADFVMVYAPLDDRELAIVLEIIRAAA